MSFGASFTGVTFFQQPGPPFAPTSADNGLSVDAGTGRIVLGNDVGGTLAQLLSDREIPLATFLLRFLDNVAGQSMNVQPTDVLNALLFGLRIIDSNVGVDATLGVDPNIGGLGLQQSGTGVTNFIYFPFNPAGFWFSDGAVSGSNAVVNVDVTQSTDGVSVIARSNPNAFALFHASNTDVAAVGAATQYSINNLGFFYVGAFGPGYPDAFMQNSIGLVTDPGPATQWTARATAGFTR